MKEAVLIVLEVVKKIVTALPIMVVVRIVGIIVVKKAVTMIVLVIV